MPQSTEVTDSLLRGWPLPSRDGSKYERGQVIVVGGAPASPGAAILAGVASLRAGAGRLTLAVGESVASTVAVTVPESAVLPLPESRKKSIDGSAVPAHDEYERADAVLIGPGLDDADETLDLLDRVIPRLGSKTTVILDAFALGVLPRFRDADTLAGRLILTPNVEEAELLLGEELGDDLQGVATIARTYGAAVTCFSSIAGPDGRTWSSRMDTPGLGTSGSGDVLAGVIAGLAARGASVDQAAVWGTHLHQRAGQLAGFPRGAQGYLAREICDAIPEAMRELEPDGH